MPADQGLAAFAQEGSERHKFSFGEGLPVRGVQAPLAQEVGKPGGVVEPLGACPVNVPLFAVDQVQPGGRFAMAFFYKIRGFHGNALNLIDPLRIVR